MSKYDIYWAGQITGLQKTIQSSLNSGSPQALSLEGLTDIGNRGSWYAKGNVSNSNPDNMAHGTALANCLKKYAKENTLRVEYIVARNGLEVQIMAKLADTPHLPQPHIVSRPPIKIKPPAQIAKTFIAPSSNQHQQNQETKTVMKLEGRTLIVLPCCARKDGVWPSDVPAPVVPPAFLRARAHIMGARPPAGVLTDPRVGIDPTPALWLYAGFLYRPLDKNLLLAAMADWLDIVILSGGYGMVHAFERISPYDATMPTYFNHWTGVNLHGALNAYIAASDPNNVIAFFSNNANLPNSYGDIYCRGAGGIGGRNVLGKYVADPMPGAAVANGKLGRLVMEVVRTRTLIQEANIPFLPPCP